MFKKSLLAIVAATALFGFNANSFADSEYADPIECLELLQPGLPVPEICPKLGGDGPSVQGPSVQPGSDLKHSPLEEHNRKIMEWLERGGLFQCGLLCF